MLTSWNGSNFRVTGPLWFTGHRWISRTKTSDAELWCFLWSAQQTVEWTRDRLFETWSHSLWRHCNDHVKRTEQNCLKLGFQKVDYHTEDKWLSTAPNIATTIFLCQPRNGWCRTPERSLFNISTTYQWRQVNILNITIQLYLVSMYRVTQLSQRCRSTIIGIPIIREDDLTTVSFF